MPWYVPTWVGRLLEGSSIYGGYLVSKPIVWRGVSAFMFSVSVILHHIEFPGWGLAFGASGISAWSKAFVCICCTVM